MGVNIGVKEIHEGLEAHIEQRRVDQELRGGFTYAVRHLDTRRQSLATYLCALQPLKSWPVIQAQQSRQAVMSGAVNHYGIAGAARIVDCTRSLDPAGGDAQTACRIERPFVIAEALATLDPETSIAHQRGKTEESRVLPSLPET